MRNVGVGLIVAVYVALVVTSTVSPVYMSSGGLAYSGSHWPFDGMMFAIAVAGIMLTLIPFRRGESWALYTQIVVLTLVIGTRFLTGPQRLVVLDPNRHEYFSMILYVVVPRGWYWQDARLGL